MTEPTLGPWRPEGPDEFGDYNILHPANSLAVAAVVSNLRPAAVVRADAHLIAAALDMYEVLKAALDRSDEKEREGIVRSERGQELYEQGRAAIAKAEGRTSGRGERLAK